MISYLGMAVMGAGVLFIMLSIVGIVVLPDFCLRIHSAGIVDSVGMVLVILGLGMYYEFSIFTIKLLVLLCLLLITNVTMCSILSNVACSTNIK
ncbi:monovalent cation/H(+) antiporter subunit G [Anaplasma bovis]|uniref:monovalent cation/H(+) antiporter subunit G n=1 Tax=Anaplasma bovis TaxID=186733 RepID=UPI002FEEA9DF